MYKSFQRPLCLCASFAVHKFSDYSRQETHNVRFHHEVCHRHHPLTRTVHWPKSFVSRICLCCRLCSFTLPSILCCFLRSGARVRSYKRFAGILEARAFLALPLLSWYRSGWRVPLVATCTRLLAPAANAAIWSADKSSRCREVSLWRASCNTCHAFWAGCFALALAGVLED